MTPYDRDVRRTVQLFIDRYGADAALEAALQAEAMLVAGRMEGAAAWREIVRAIESSRANEQRTEHRNLNNTN